MSGMLEQSHLCASRAWAWSDAARVILERRGWRVYRTCYPSHEGDVQVFCRKADLSQGFKTRIIRVKSSEIDAWLSAHL